MAQLLVLLALGQGVSDLKSNEHLVFLPTLAHYDPDAALWICDVHGWVYEPEAGSITRKLALAALCRALDLEPKHASSVIFRQRAGMFLVDNQRGKEVVIELVGRRIQLPKSEVNGHFRTQISVPAEDVAPLTGGTPPTRDARLTFTAVLDRDDERVFGGTIWLLAPIGVSVVSDIDDTIKFTQVGNRDAMLSNTFLQPFKAVPGMVDRYRVSSREGATFHYVSASPWQLYPALTSFLRQDGFPGGTFHLKSFRALDKSVFDLFCDPEKYKLEILQPLLARFPNRRFVLVGDSGELDPEIYGRLARQFPNQVTQILIRDVSQKPLLDQPRFERAFAELPRNHWQVFRYPSEMVDPSKLPR